MILGHTWSVVIIASALTIIMLGVVHAGWHSAPSQIKQLQRGWPFVGAVGFVRIWRAQLAGVIFLLLLNIAFVILLISGASLQHRSILAGVLATACIAFGLILMIIVALTGSPKILVPPNFQNIDMVKVKKGSYSQKKIRKMGSALDMSIFLILIPELTWYIILIASHISTVIYIYGSLTVLTLGLAGLYLAIVRRRRIQSS